MVGTAQARLCPPYAFCTRRRLHHHSPRFQLTQIASARLRPTTDPSCDAATLSAAIAMPSPINPPALLAITAAVRGAPTAGRKSSLTVVEQDGKNADDTVVVT